MACDNILLRLDNLKLNLLTQNGSIDLRNVIFRDSKENISNSKDKNIKIINKYTISHLESLNTNT